MTYFVDEPLILSLAYKNNSALNNKMFGLYKLKRFAATNSTHY